MSIDVSTYFADQADLAARTAGTLSAGLTGSVILKIAAEVTELEATGASVANFTIGDFSPAQFRIPDALVERIDAALRAGHTSYPPAVGVTELRQAVVRLYERELGLKYPVSSVQIGSGARPPIYAAFASVLNPGDQVVYPVPSWNNNYYIYLNQAEGIAVPTRPEEGFMPALADLEPYLRTARVICLNSPSNPTGTVIRRDQLQAITDAIVVENERRTALGERPLILFYDQVYWQLTFGQARHLTPVELNPAVAPYTVFIDAISKCWAATGLRVGWAVVPPWLLERMKPLIGHMGAWAGRAEQIATASLLDEPETIAPYLSAFKQGIQDRMDRLHGGLMGLAAEGLPVDALVPQGAIYLTARVQVDGLSEEEVRRALLHEAGVAVVPFSAFGFPSGSGWMRFSVGAVSLADIDGAIERLRAFLVARRG